MEKQHTHIYMKLLNSLINNIKRLCCCCCSYFISICNAEDLGLIPGSRISPGERNGYPLQYSSWRIPQTEEPGGLQSRGHKQSDMTEEITFSLSYCEGNDCLCLVFVCLFTKSFWTWCSKQRREILYIYIYIRTC